MLKSIIDYVKHHYQFCENIESFYLTNSLNTTECYIKRCLIYKYLFELYFRRNVSLNSVMSVMDNTYFLFISNSPVLKNHLIFHHATKTFWKRHKEGRSEIYIFDTTIRSSILGFVTGVVCCFFSRRSSINNIIQILYYIIEKIHQFYTNYHKTLMFYQKV